MGGTSYRMGNSRLIDDNLFWHSNGSSVPEFMWNRVTALPWEVHVIGIGLLLFAAIKARAIKKACDTAMAWCWKELRKRVSPDPNAKTYKGTFQGFYQFENYPHEWFFTVIHKCVITKVPTMKTNLLSSVQRGAFVEIDTQVLPGAKVEVVRRVRVQMNRS